MKKINQWLLAIVALFALTACQPAVEEQPKTVGTEQTEATQTTYPLTIKDASGEEVTLEEQPKQIISLMPSNTEILYALGLQEAMIGVTTNDDYPEEVKELETFGDFQPNIEKIIEAQPDLVVAHELNFGSKEGIDQLKAAGIPVVYIQNANHFEDTYQTIEQLGEITNTQSQAQQIIHQMKEEIKNIQQLVEKADKKTVFVETSGVPDIYSPGSHTFIDEMLTLVQAENIVQEESFVLYSPEKIVEQNPEVIIVMYDYIPEAVEEIKKRPGFDQVTAVQQDQVIQVDENLLSRQGPRLVEGLRLLAEAIHPEQMK